MGFESVGFQGHVYLTPTDVSFSNVKFQEGTANAVATGFFASVNGEVHPLGDVLSIANCNINTGCTPGDDTVDSNDNPPPFSVGDFLWAIPWQYQASGGAFIAFTTVNHHETADATGLATIEKAGAGPYSKNASDPTSTY